MPHDADVGRQLAASLVAQPKPSRHGAEAGPQPAAQVVTAEEIELDQRLEYQPVGQEQLVLRLGPAGQRQEYD